MSDDMNVVRMEVVKVSVPTDHVSDLRANAERHERTLPAEIRLAIRSHLEIVRKAA